MKRQGSNADICELFAMMARDEASIFGLLMML